MIGIYYIKNLLNNKYYVGQSVRIEERWKEHRREAYNSTLNYPLYLAIRKYGIENFEFKVIEKCNKDELDLKEQFWIDYYNSYHNGYNQRENKGEAPQFSKGKLTKEDVIYIRTQQLKGIPRREVYKVFQNKITLSGFSQCWVGKTWNYIMPEAIEFIKSNHKELVSSTRSNRAKYSREEIIKIRTYKKNGMTCYQCHKQYFPHIPESSFNRIWNTITYKDIEV